MSIPQSWPTSSCSVQASSSNCRNLYYWKLWFKLKSCSTAALQKERFFKFKFCKLKTRPAHCHIVTASRLTKQCDMKNKQFSISDKLSFQPLTTRSTHEERTCVKIHFYEFPVSHFANRAHSYQWFWMTFFCFPKVTTPASKVTSSKGC